MPPRLLILFLIAVTFAFSARAETFKDTISGLEVLPLSYGANNLKIDGKNALIVRGDFNTETASGGDVYSILVREGDDWKTARYDKDTRDSILIVASPHTYEDSIVSVRFMVPKGTSNPGNASSLYLLKSAREYMKNEAGEFDPNARETKVVFTLFILQRSNDFGIFYLHELSSAQAQHLYCNADWAMKQELGIPLPDKNPEQYVCLEQK